MRVLVATASRHGATAEIAEEIAATLRTKLGATYPDAAVDVRAADEVTTVDGYDAALLGSGVYMGHWLKPARALVENHVEALWQIPVWLFSSGPIGDPAKPREDPADVASLGDSVRARGHRLFAGKLDKHDLGFAERTLTAAMRVPIGDFRDWATIQTWAGEVADELSGHSSRSGAR
jgi:menaquinone-dependent protoporphyrinogen oxidase